MTKKNKAYHRLETIITLYENAKAHCDETLQMAYRFQYCGEVDMLETIGFITHEEANDLYTELKKVIIG